MTAAELYCPRCRAARPVRERLLLVLPTTDLHEYRCAACGESCGTREVKHGPAGLQPISRRNARTRPAHFP